MPVFRGPDADRHVSNSIADLPLAGDLTVSLYFSEKAVQGDIQCGRDSLYGSQRNIGPPPLDSRHKCAIDSRVEGETLLRDAGFLPKIPDSSAERGS